MSDTKKLKYAGLIRRFKNKKCQLKCYGEFNEKRKKYKLYKIVINPKYRTRTLLITSGFHGEEFNGPISLLNIFDDITAYAKKMQVRVIIYPCVNPSGFDLCKRYNASDEEQNNYFMEYKVKGGRWVGVLKKGEKYHDFRIADSPAKEVRLLKRDVLRYKVPNGVLDIHQQKGHLDTGNTYTYICRRRRSYYRIMKQISEVTKVATNDPDKYEEGDRVVNFRIDRNGFVLLHDGSITDMFYQLGSMYAIAVETDTRLCLNTVCKINYIWISELMQLIARKQ